MKRVFIIHGWGGNPDEPVLKWLGEQLQQKRYEVFRPEMPDTDNPKIEEWVGKLDEIVGKPTKNDYFIGHSIGCQTILRYLETHISEKKGTGTLSVPVPFFKVGGAVFIAGWFTLENMESEEEEQIAKPWITIPIDAEKIKKVLPKSTLIISDNDPYDAFEYNKQKFAELDSKIIVLPNAGHITEEDGFTELPIALEELEGMK